MGVKQFDFLFSCVVVYDVAISAFVFLYSVDWMKEKIQEI